MAVLRHHVNPSNVFDSLAYGYSQAVVTEGGRTVHCAGQVGIDEHGALAGDDVAAQLPVALENLRRVLQAAGGTPADVVHVRALVVGLDDAATGVCVEAMADFFDRRRPPATTLMGVDALALADLRVEIEATAVVGSTD